MNASDHPAYVLDRGTPNYVGVRTFNLDGLTYTVRHAESGDSIGTVHVNEDGSYTAAVADARRCIDPATAIRQVVMYHQLADA